VDDATTKRPPKAFICHASEDKERFVVPFATALRAHGVNAWLDRWQMQPGDSLVDKIFEEGLKNADCFIIVLSHNSVDKPWVREEMNAAFVKRLEGKPRIIPMLIDDCQVPEALKSTLWVRVRDPNSFDAELKDIVATIHGQKTQPTIGKAPRYATATPVPIPGLQPVDAWILKAACELAVEGGHRQGIGVAAIQSKLEMEGDVSQEQVDESLAILDEHGLVEGTDTTGQRGSVFVDVTVSGMDRYAKACVPDYTRILERICFAIVNEEMTRLEDFVSLTGVPSVICEQVLDTLQRKGLAEVGRYHSSLVEVLGFSPRLKRALDQRSSM